MKKLVHGGKYRHFKGMEYRVIKIVEIQEETMVLYQKLYGDYSYWLRPVEMFLDYKNGVKRFVYIGDFTGNLELPKKIKAIHSETEKIYEIILDFV